ncbi:oligosaccharide flippase family protein [Paraglaciecola aquimarina]|uniref:Oligosaccharide flippase family protein n=1 Tax=Paraglaciecola algarum TaxID=3050085 RepID=A0ABS9DA81_9ALTE|nr:oligosaccharide flippase family protein [Paraglaciecola sp. G1-23]MCF2949654.1 oligosaccharide flippase family protein [Paraglaciecola sp. G1-23]
MYFIKVNSNKRLLNNTSWLLVTEVAAKVSRIAVIFALAATLTAIEYGTVMLALACHEIFKLILRSGAGAQIIQCSDKQLPQFAQNGMLLQWLVCLLLASSQAALAFPIADFYNNPELLKLIALMAIVYLFYPLVSVKVFLVQRANNMRFFSIRNALCILTENLSIALFALLDCGIMSVVYGKWVFASLWILLFYFAPVKSFGVGFQAHVFLSLCKTSGQLLCTELVRALRMQLDMLIGARLLSPELFGLYCFAKSAGVGLSQSINNAFNAGLYPHLCDKHRANKLIPYVPTVYAITSIVGCLFLLQALLVPFYVPLLFSQEWQQNHTVIILLCLAALPAIFIDTQCNLLRAKAAYQSELYVRLYCLLITTACLLAIQAATPQIFALTILVSSLLWLLALIPYTHLKNLFLFPATTRS